MHRALVIVLLAAALVIAACSPAKIGYDSSADPFAQLARAQAQARAENKLVLVVAGGDWCSTCHHLHEFLEEDAQTRALLEDAFVQVQVYIGEENFNSAFFEKLPPTNFVPHYWVLTPDGRLLGEQSVEALEIEGSDDYDPERFASFVRTWEGRT